MTLIDSFAELQGALSCRIQERREERRAERGADHYRMRQELVSIGDDYWIENDRDERV
jgi:hypothetical protein